jgi:hypothetical protein
MQKTQSRLLLFIFLLISLINTAFIIKNKNVSTENSTKISVEAPPQYKTQKLTFFERILLKKMLKKLKPTQEIDLDAAVTDAKKMIKISLVLLISSVALFFVISLLAVLPLLASAVFAIIGISRANFVIKHPEVTGIQEKQAKTARTEGYCSLIMFSILVVIIVLLIRLFYF